MATPKLWRAVFVAAPGTGLERDDGQTRRPITAAEMNAEWLWLAMQGHFPVTIQGPTTPEERKHLRNFLSRPGRPHASHHHEWARLFWKLYAEACAMHELHHEDGDRPPSKIEIAFEVACQLPGPLGYDPRARPKNAARTVLMAVNRLSKR
jgi:hypothetical protein